MTMRADDDVERTPATELDEECAEGWRRLSSEPDARGVEAIRRGFGADAWPWQLTVWAMEFVRKDPLEGGLRRAIDAALRQVPGVTDVAQEDREVG